ncbi:hypothetical protein [Bosea sp. NBC_00550]|uniref:hypothetical protein n=1 Tax=Bosea sp. NBC_00550 TaxID=2969621 RepID=UPI002232CB22|nr:hypothetical protein [Bosea sp. NBC_00550]UZF95735.1 hypothetical protein NWE53_27485 [Bosea sp. NBC_00550]
MRALLVLTTLIFLTPTFSHAQQQRGSEKSREECKEEARRVHKQGRNSQMSRDERRAIQRDYVRACRGRAPKA